MYLCCHSLQEFSSEELHSRRGHLHQALEDEKKERIHVLDIRQALALEAKSKTRELAGMVNKCAFTWHVLAWPWLCVNRVWFGLIH